MALAEIPDEKWFAVQLDKIVEIYNIKLSGDASFAGEANYVRMLLDKISVGAGYVVDIAASNGVAQSCTLQLFQDERWKGLAVEFDSQKFAVLAFVYSAFENARLARCRVTPGNVLPLLMGYEVPLDFDLLNLDIDSYDYFVLQSMLSGGFRPKIITMEINEKIPASLFFTVTYKDDHYWKGDHFYGCSIGAASHLVKPFGYYLESVQFNNAFFVREDCATRAGIADCSPAEAYSRGYADHPERESLFPWNANVDAALRTSPAEAVKIFEEIFSNKYDNYILKEIV